MTDTPKRDRLDRATSDRLAKLAARPVDTSRLESRLEAALRDDALPATTPAARPGLWSRSFVGLAAAVLIGVSVVLLVMQPGASPAMAAPSELAEIHFDVTNGLTPHLEVSTIEEANRVLAEQSPNFAPLPDIPGELQSCCLHQHAGEMLTCAVVEHDGQLITIAIAHGADLRSPEGKVLERGGKKFVVHRANGITMVMRSDAGRWLCVMGEADPETLADVAAEVDFD